MACSGIAACMSCKCHHCNPLFCPPGPMRIRPNTLLLSSVLVALLSSADAVPVAVNDSFSTNEDTDLALSGSAFLAENFDLPLNDTRGFTFVAHIFGSSATTGAGTGTDTDIQGNPPGGLQTNQTFRALAGAN